MAGALTRPRVELRRRTAEIIERNAHAEGGERDLHRVGVELCAIKERALWRADGHESFERYAKTELGISRRHAYRLMRVARSFDAAVVARHGVTKLDAVLEYFKATADEAPDDPFAVQLRIRSSDGTFHTMSIHEATVADIHAATKGVRRSQRGRQQGRIPAAWRRRAERLERGLPPAPAGTATGARVRLNRAADGSLAISFLAIPVDDLAAFVAIVGDLLPQR